jgi:hypothetical protein
MGLSDSVHGIIRVLSILALLHNWRICAAVADHPAARLSALLNAYRNSQRER